MQKTCKACGNKFIIRKEDAAFYEKVGPVFNGKTESIPPPTLCPQCRYQRRLCMRNERSLYERTCDKTRKRILSIYSPESNRVVYERDEWWSDNWDARAYGRDIDWNRPFFEQLEELMKVVPRPSVHVFGNENCDYVNQCAFSKDCYLSYNCDFSERCLYCNNTPRCRDCMDLLNGENCELCFDSSDLHGCYHVVGSTKCKNSNNLTFCESMIGCSDCYGCINLRNKTHCFFNEQLSKDAYERRRKTIDLSSRKTYDAEREKVRVFLVMQPHRCTEMVQCENSIGDYLNNCKNAYHCFDSFENQDIAYSTVLSSSKDCWDYDIGGYGSELCMEIMGSGIVYHCSFCLNLWGDDRELLYCDIARNAQHCFGCVSMRNNQYCILNKQYAKEEYEKLVPKIIDYMKKTGEWGEFFPVSLSPFGYNESVAQQFLPQTKVEALERGFKWSDYEAPAPKVTKVHPASSVPDRSGQAPDGITTKVYSCERTGKPFRIESRELAFVKQQGLPVPRLHPNERHRDRLSHRNPRRLCERPCMNCGKPMQTTYAPERTEIVWCEECYLKVVY